MKKFSNRNITLYFFFYRTLDYLRKDDLLGISPGITYHLIMGFIPFLIFAVNVVLFSTAADIDYVVNIVHTYFPARMADTLEADIQRIVDQRSDLWLWVSLLAAAYSFEQALALLVRATDDLAYSDKNKQNYPRKTKRHNFLVHLKSAMFSVGLVLAIILSLGLTVFGNILLQWVGQNFTLPQIILNGWNFFIYGIPFFVLVLYLTIFYRAAPKSYTPRLKHAVVTAFIVTVLWLVATTVYSWLLIIIPSIGESYGPLFGLFIMFIWFRYIVLIIIAGICLLKTWRDLQHKLDCFRKKKRIMNSCVCFK